VAIPVGILVLAALVAWAGLGATASWRAVVGAAADVWFLGHGVDVVVPADQPFALTVTFLGPALVTVLTGVRAGRRAGATAVPALALAAGVAVVVLVSVLLLLLARADGAGPAPVQAVLLPAAVYGVALLVGLLPGRRPALRGPLVAGLRGGTGAALVVLAGGAVGVVAALAVHLTAVVGLYESVHAGIAGGLALTVLQIALMPTVVVWAAAWLTGAGFLLGTGSSVGPVGTTVGPQPSLPVLGALPQHVGAFGLAGVLVPVLAGFGVGIALRIRGDGGRSGLQVLATGILTGVVAGLLLAGLAAAASGAIGPGRLAEVGPDALQVGWRAAAEVGLAALLGGAVTRPRAGRSTADRERERAGAPR